MKDLFYRIGFLIILVSFTLPGLSQDMPPPRLVDKDYRKEYREALKEAERNIERSQELPGDIIQLPMEELVPVDKVNLLELQQDGLAWHIPVIAPDKTRERLAEAWKHTVYIEGFDTGIDEDHSKLQYGKLPSIDFIGEPGGDKNGHGTHTLGTIVGEEYGLLWPVVGDQLFFRANKVLNKAGSGNFNLFANGHGTRYAEYKKWRNEGSFVVTVNSLGADISHQLEYVNFELRKGWDHGGIMHVAAAGNSNNAIDYPGSSPYTMAIGAVDQQLIKAYFSCFGPQMTAVAPGIGIYAPYIGGGYAKLNGTSMATPMIVAFVAACYGIHGEKLADPNDLIRYTAKCSRDLGDAGWDEYYGYGLAMLNKILEVSPDFGDDPDNPTPPPTGPATDWTVTFTTGGQIMRWTPTFNKEYNILQVPTQKITCVTETTSPEAAYDACYEAVDQYYHNRAIIGVKNSLEATVWTGKFMEIIVNKDGDLLIEVDELTGLDNADRNFIVTDFDPQGGTRELPNVSTVTIYP